MINPVDKSLNIGSSQSIQENEKKKKEIKKQTVDSANISVEAKNTYSQKQQNLQQLAEKGLDINVLMKVDALEPLLRQDKITQVQKLLLENHYQDKGKDIVNKIVEELFG